MIDKSVLKIKTSEEIVSGIAYYPADISYDIIPNIKWVSVKDIIKKLNEIIDSLPKHSCDIDSSIIGDLIKELENAK